MKPGNDIPETLKQPHDGDLCREGKRDDKPVTKKEVSSPILPNSATEGENLKTPNPMSSASRRRRNRKKNKQLKGGNMDDASDSLSVKQSDTEPAGTAHQRTVKREVSKKHGPPEKNSSLPNKREQAKGGKVKEKNDEKSNDSSLPDKSRLVKGGKMKKKNEKTSNHSSLPDKNGQAKGSKVKEKNDERSNHSSLPNKSGLVKEMKEKNEETSNHSLLPNESGQAKVGKAKEKKEETSNQTNAGNKTPKPRPFKISVKSEKLVVRVDEHDKREVEVDKRTGTNAQPNKRRRRRSGRKKKSIDSEGIERRDERPGNDSVARKSTRAKTPGGQTNTKSEVKK